MIVEDDKKVASFLEQGLREEGYAVDVTHDGTDGFLRASVNEYDLLLLDVMLPGKTGLEIVRGLEADCDFIGPGNRISLDTILFHFAREPLVGNGCRQAVETPCTIIVQLYSVASRNLSFLPMPLRRSRGPGHPKMR